MARSIVSHRLAGTPSASEQDASRSPMEGTDERFSAFASVQASAKSKHRPESETTRRTLILDADPRDIEAKRKELPPDVMVEPEVLRQPASLIHDIASVVPSIGPAVLGSGESLHLIITAQGAPLAGVAVNVMLVARVPGAGQQTMTSTVTDAKGNASINYDSQQWTPSVAIVVPREGFWSWWQTNPQNRMVIDLQALPKSGPVGWWHQIMGINQQLESEGEGIRIGVVDSGVGPHPYLTQVEAIGAFINGNYDKSPRACLDAQDHGTHVSGIINARPSPSSGDFIGIAPGADVFMARVFPNQAEQKQTQSTGANQGDIANAIDELRSNHQVDLINLSLGGPTPSQIELD